MDAMVVIKITERKRKRCDWDDVPSSSVLDLTEDADEESAGEEDERREKEERGSPNLSPMKEEQEDEGEGEEEVLKACFPSNESDDSNSPPLDSDTEAHPPLLGEHDKDIKSGTKEVATEPSIEEIVIPADEVEPEPPIDCDCLHLRFTAEVVELVERRGGECQDIVLLQWPLEQINLLGFYSNIDKPEDSRSLVVVRITPPNEDASSSKYGDGRGTFIIQVPYLKSKLQDIMFLSRTFNELFKELLREDVLVLRADIKMEGSETYIPSNPTSTGGLKQALDDFQGLVYPQNDPDAVTITQKDIRILDPSEFLNDTIIDFYIKYLLQTLVLPERLETLHVFNSFFFSKLAETDMSYKQGRAAFERVKKWTRKIDIFEKDYIFIPVNQSLHWSLIIICHPGHMWDTGPSTVGDACILHLDSMEGCHRGLEGHIKNYLFEEWMERNPDEDVDFARDFFDHIKFVYAKVPQQDNNCDCGLFLLHYVELFLEQAPENFSLKSIRSLKKNFLRRTWFKPFEASAKRPVIQKLILDLSEGRSPDSKDALKKESSFEANGDLSGVEELNRQPSNPLPDDERSASDSYPSSSSPGDTSHQVRREELNKTTETEIVHLYDNPGISEHIQSLEIDGILQPLYRRDGEMEYSTSHWDHRLPFGADKLSLSNEAIVLIDDDPVHTSHNPPPPPGAEICNFQICPLPRLSQVIPLQIPTVCAPMKESTELNSQPSSLELQDGGMDHEVELSLLDCNTTKFEETRNTLRKAFSSSRAETAVAELDKNSTKDNDWDMFQNGRLDGNDKNITTGIPFVGEEPGSRRALESSIRPGGASQTEYSPPGRPSRELFLSDDGASTEEKTLSPITSLLERAEASLQQTPIPIRMEEDQIRSSKYSESERLGVTVRLKKTRERCPAPRRAKNMKSFEFTDEVEELSSDDSLERWDFPKRGKSLDSSLTPPMKEVGQRLTRSSAPSTEGKKLSPRKQKKKDALAKLMEEKRNKKR